MVWIKFYGVIVMKENNFKLVCLDLDGTLLTSERKIDDETLAYLQKLSRNDIKIAIATGRAAFDARNHAKLVGWNTYFIGGNGAAVGAVNKKILLFEEYMNNFAVEELWATAEKFGIKPVFYTKNYIICTTLRQLALHYHFMVKRNPENRRHVKFAFGKKNFLRRYYKNAWDIEKALFFIFDKEKMNDAEKSLDDSLFEIAVTSKNCIEISRKDVNKSSAVKNLAEHLNISADEIIAFGDSENDRAMLKFVGKGVAMWNAPKTIRDVADDLTESNDEQGILIKLKEIFNI